ncbi:MAG: double zinc ribbon domain-containing protein [Patescibacteria group bacterium]|nr:double zinc ribbon domain-containing protein [Patescibacteria group bacterium]
MDIIPYLLDLIFPPRCVVCSAFDTWWCKDCRAKSEFSLKNLCPACNHVNHVEGCSRTSQLDGLVAAGFYHDPGLRKVIHAFKYRGGTVLMDAVAEYLQVWRGARLDIWPWAGLSELAIQPLIGAPKSVRTRGFDQAALLSGIIKEKIVPWAQTSEILHRRESLTAQAALEHGKMRHANINGVFSVRSDVILPENILLVDDVVTTGATMQEAARILKAAGVKKVFGLALAVGS